MKTSKLRTLIIAICIMIPATVSAYRWEFAPNEHMFHRECAPATEYHAFMANQKYEYKLWKRSHNPRRIGVQRWLKEHEAFLEKQMEERTAFQTDLSEDCIAQPWI